MKKLLPSLIGLATLMAAAPALAHDGDHSGVFANIGHWISSPSHGLLSLTVIAALGIVAFKLTRKNTEQ